MVFRLFAGSSPEIHLKYQTHMPSYRRNKMNKTSIYVDNHDIEKGFHCMFNKFTWQLRKTLASGCTCQWINTVHFENHKYWNRIGCIFLKSCFATKNSYDSKSHEYARLLSKRILCLAKGMSWKLSSKMKM